MRPRLTRIGILLLVMIVAMVGLTSCERKAQPRESDVTETVEGSQTSGAVSGRAQTPAPGETIVSAVTPDAQETADQTTPGAPAEGTPVASAPTVTNTPVGAAEQPAAQPAPTQAPSAASGGVYHVVQRGETLYSIATRYGTTWQVVAQANNLSNPQMIYVGQKLLIPTSGSAAAAPPPSSGCRIRHTVKAGEWVWQIARDYGVSPYDVLAANGLTILTGRTIQPGTVLCIP